LLAAAAAGPLGPVTIHRDSQALFLLSHRTPLQKSQKPFFSVIYCFLSDEQRGVAACCCRTAGSERTDKFVSVSKASFRFQILEAKFTYQVSYYTVAILFLFGNNCLNID
jgi:hypothetical protein